MRPAGTNLTVHEPGYWAWTDHANCQGTDPAEFFRPPAEPYPPRHILDLCDRCPVTDRCLAHALQHGEYGIWGGTTTHQRRRLRRQLRIPVRPIHAPWTAAALAANPDVARARMKAARRHMEPGLRTERNENP